MKHHFKSDDMFSAPFSQAKGQGDGGVMQSECGRYLSSVSDLYVGDEVSVLLEEIRELEGPGRGPDELQDFEIAGSQTGGVDTPADATTVHSWDSHAHYKHHLPGSSPTHSIFSGVVLYCDDTHLKTSTGIIRVLLVVSSVACLACLCSSGTVTASLFMLPLVTRLRLMMFSTVFSVLVTLLFLFLDISHVVYLFPFNWGKFNAVVYLVLSLLYILSSSLLLHLLNTYSETYHWVPKWTNQQLLVTGILGYVCALEALILCVVSKCEGGQYTPVDEEPSSMTLQERHGITRDSPTPTTLPSGHTSAPSATAPLLYDVQPCSSKHQDPYHLVA